MVLFAAKSFLYKTIKMRNKSQRSTDMYIIYVYVSLTERNAHVGKSHCNGGLEKRSISTSKSIGSIAQQ